MGQMPNHDSKSRRAVLAGIASAIALPFVAFRPAIPCAAGQADGGICSRRSDRHRNACALPSTRATTWASRCWWRCEPAREAQFPRNCSRRQPPMATRSRTSESASTACPTRSSSPGIPTQTSATSSVWRAMSLARSQQLRGRSRTWADLVQAARKDPGLMAYGSPGALTGSHVAMALTAERLGLRLNHVPYKGGSEVRQAILSGQVPVGSRCDRCAAHHVRPVSGAGYMD